MTSLPELHFLGDSHLRAPRFAAEQGWFEPRKCHFTLVGGATAIGLRHPKSKTQALAVYREVLLPFRPNVIPVFQLGEVDCGFVIWVRAQRYAESVSEQLDQSLRAYVSFLRDIRDAGYGALIVTPAVLPTIRDGQLDGEVSHLRREVQASYRQRTDLTLAYNARLAEMCEAEKFTYVDFMPDLLDSETCLLDARFRHSDPADHHLDPNIGGRLWVGRITEALNRLVD